jgi:hypothetical protein
LARGAIRDRPYVFRIRFKTDDRHRVMFRDMTSDERGVLGFVRRPPRAGASARTARAARAARRS